MAKLFIVPTPIGNLEDITLRAIRILKEADLILAEDTRTSSTLMKRYEIGVHMESHHKYNEHKSVEKITEKILSGMNIALISDAGTPGISDPGFLLVRECLEKGIEVETLPGATAFVPALVNSGYPADRFCFEGFLPMKKGRQTRLKELAAESRTMIFYESPHRILKALQSLNKFCPEKKIAIGRELTKIHEEMLFGRAEELLVFFEENSEKVRGEFVVIVG